MIIIRRANQVPPTFADEMQQWALARSAAYAAALRDRLQNTGAPPNGKISALRMWDMAHPMPIYLSSELIAKH